MTLILACINRQQAIQVSDRMLSSDGVPLDKRMSKSIAVVSNDSRFCVGYTGLATAGSFDTREWLMTTILEVGPPDYDLASIGQGLGRRLTERFRTLRITNRQKPLTVLLTGYRYLPTADPTVRDAQMFLCAISNIEAFPGTPKVPPGEARPDFSTFFQSTRDPDKPHVLRIGLIDSLTPADIAPLEALVRELAPAPAIVEKAADLIRRGSRTTVGAGMVGADVMSCVVPMDPALPIGGEYLPEHAEPTARWPDQIMVRSEGSYAVRDVEMSAGNPETTAPLAIRRVARNAPCPCGSPYKYKRCHGDWRVGQVGYEWWAAKDPD